MPDAYLEVWLVGCVRCVRCGGKGGEGGKTNMPHKGEVLIVGEHDGQGNDAGVAPRAGEEARDEGFTLPCAHGESGCQNGSDAPQRET